MSGKPDAPRINQASRRQESKTPLTDLPARVEEALWIDPKDSPSLFFSPQA
jgi:hypothetical protein